tara:strand:+ start:705 stop:1946 length:1242 start_codon:yes stop_codon:yes gene_type:complete
LNIEKFIAKRLDQKKSKKQYSKSISKLCTIAISSSIAIIIISICTGKGLEENIKKNFIDINSNITVESYYNSKNEHYIKKNKIYLNDSILNVIQEIPGVLYINPVISTFGIISNKKNFLGIILNGIGTTSNSSFLNKKILTGRKPLKKFEILISDFQAKKMHLNLNDTILLSFLRKKNDNYDDTHSNMVITGIYKTEIEDFDKNICFTSLEYIQKKMRWDKKVSYYQIFLKDNKHTKKITNLLNNDIESISKNYEIKSFSIYEKYPNVFNWITLFKKNIILITIIMLIVCLINITNFILVMVIERIHMIGILKSFGCSNYQILKIFFYRSTNIVIKGLIYGNTTALTICLIQKIFKIIKLDSSSYFVNEIPIYFDFYSIFLMNFLILALIPIAIMIPYFRISKLSLSNSLKIK